MNAPFGEARDLAPRPPGLDGRRVRARLRFAHAGGRSVLREQFVPYPLHITRTFRLDRERPDLATLYLQSASGGLYRDDDIHLALDAEAGAAVHVTTQAATVVHDSEGRAARQHLALRVEAGAFAAVTFDPVILLPGAELDARTDAVVHPDGTLILADGFASHDPLDAGRLFARIALQTRLLRPDGALLLFDRGMVEAADIARVQGVLGPYRAAGTLLVAAPFAFDEERLAALEAAAVPAGCVAGATRLSGGAGVLVRLLAQDGGHLARGLDFVFALAAQALLGFAPARRRK